MNSVNAGSGGDTINITALGTITLTKSPLGLTKNVTINGPGAALLTISGMNSYQIFTISSGVTATISGVTLANGSSNGGGAIFSDGTLTVISDTFSGNSAIGGGAIYNHGAGVLTVTNCTFSVNTATTNEGGAIDNPTTGTVNVSNSTFLGNNGAQSGGAIASNINLTVVNSTITGNSATAAVAFPYLVEPPRRLPTVS